MILLDTNVISEPLKANPSTQVVDWLDAQQLETLFLPVVAVAELRFGIAAMPAGKKRTALQKRIENEVLPLFLNRVLPFDVNATSGYASCMTTARSAGAPVSAADGFIGAIAAANNLAIATRDIVPFEAMGLRVINPWLD